MAFVARLGVPATVFSMDSHSPPDIRPQPERELTLAERERLRYSEARRFRSRLAQRLAENRVAEDVRRGALARRDVSASPRQQ